MNPQDSANVTQWNTGTVRRFLLTVINAINTHIAARKNIRTRTAQRSTRCAAHGSIKRGGNNEHNVTANPDLFYPVIAGREAQIKPSPEQSGLFSCRHSARYALYGGFSASGCTDIRRFRFRLSCGLYSVPSATVHSFQICARQRRTVYLPHRSRRTHRTKHPTKDTPKQ